MTRVWIKRLGSFKLLSANFNPKSSVEPEIFPIFQHKVEQTSHFTRVTEVRHIFNRIILQNYDIDIPLKFCLLPDWLVPNPHCCHNKCSKLCRPQRSWGKVIFSEACVKNSIHGGSAPLHARIHTPLPGIRGRHPPGTRHPPRSRPPQRSVCWEIRATSGRYASYWNAILFIFIFAPSPLITKSFRGE